MSEDVHVDVGAYVADALEPAERDAFEAHLAGCARCRREVAEFAETTARLSVLTETAPPPELRASVLAAIGQVRPLPPLPEQGRGGDVVEAAPDAAAAVPDDELARRRQARLTRLLTGLAAAAVVVALALGGWAVSLQQRVAEVTAQEQLVTEVLTAPDATVVPVQLPDGSRAAYTVSREQDRAVFAAERLPETEPGKVYQLWTMHVDETGAPEPGTVRPGDTFTGGEQVRVVFGAVRDTEALAITVEDAPGSQTPTTEPFGFAQV